MILAFHFAVAKIARIGSRKDLSSGAGTWYR